MLSTHNLRYRYTRRAPTWALDGINLTIESGEYVLLCGESGSGKSTLCRTFNGLIPHFYGGEFEGHVHVAGLDTRDHPVSDLFAHVGMVFQNPEAQLFNSTVERELAFGLESLSLPRDEIRRRVAESAESVGITNLLGRAPHQLSGGEQVLVAIAAVLATQPQAIVLDEPYTNLDPFNVERVSTALRDINARGTTIVLTEHHLQRAAADAGRLVILHEGRVALDGPPREVLTQDVEALGLNLPAVVRAAREGGYSEVPLTVEEFVSMADDDIRPDVLSPETQGLTPAGEPVLRLDNVSFAFDDTPVLCEVTLDVHAGECLAIVGANGAGKTTLIKHFNGLYHPDRGRALVTDHDTRVTNVSTLARHVGLAFQTPDNQFFKFTVWDEIAAGARALGRYDEEWLRELVDLFGLDPLLERSPYRLSGGEKKRVAFASALAANPEVLVLDEPTAGQDWHFRRTVGNLLNRLRDRGQTIVIVTHDLDFAEEHASRWALLGEGRLLAMGRPDEVMVQEDAMRLARLTPTQRFRLWALGSRADVEVPRT